MYNICIGDIWFEWDENKNLANQDKHNISFEEAMTVFLDYDGLVIADPEHSEYEDRFIIIGLSKNANILTVVHCARQSDSVIRIISARTSTKNETKQYISRRNS
jgi:uncharacterized DUF497 family protein